MEVESLIKLCLQKLADENPIKVSAIHFQPDQPMGNAYFDLDLTSYGRKFTLLKTELHWYGFFCLNCRVIISANTDKRCCNCVYACARHLGQYCWIPQITTIIDSTPGSK